MGWVGTNALETVKPRKTIRPEVDCMSELPLRQFKRGQRLYFKKTLRTGFHLNCPGRFVRIERGLVVIQVEPEKGGWTPDWLDKRSLEEMCPGNITRVRPTACYLWGKDREGLHKRCHWFVNLDDPVDPAAMVEASIDWMHQLLNAPAVKALE